MSRQDINRKLLRMGSDILKMRGLLDNQSPSYIGDTTVIRDISTKILSASFLSDIELKSFLLDEILSAASDLDTYGLISTANNIISQTHAALRPNMDYSEGWNVLMDKFREGKIKGIHEWISTREKAKKRKRKVRAHHSFGRGNIEDLGYVAQAPMNKGVDLCSHTYSIPTLNNEISVTFSSIEQNNLQAEALLLKYERLRKVSKKKKDKDTTEKASYPSPFDSYCDSKKTRQYWMQLKDKDDSGAVGDFINYIKQVKCPEGQYRLASFRRVSAAVEIEMSVPPPGPQMSYTVPISSLPPREQMLRIKQPSAQASIYRHLNVNPLRSNNLRVGDPILKGDEIGLTGASGRVTGPHLHVERLENGTQVDPSSYQQGFYPTIPGGARVTSPFGGRINPITKQKQQHRGVDIGGVGYNTPVIAMSDGVIEFIGSSPTSGWMIKLRHYMLPTKSGI